MAYTPHVLVAFGGSWASDPGEIWECTVRLSADGGGGVTIDPEAYLTAIKTPLGTWFHATATAMAAAATLDWVKANHIGADGLYVDKTTTHLRDYTPGVAGVGNMQGPQFVTLAYTWETALLRGAGHRGRIYPPNGTKTPYTAFLVGNGDRDANATAGAALLSVLKNSAGANGTKGVPVVASKVNGAVTPITGCSSDNIYDVQRRRKNRIKGNRSATIVPT